MTIPKIEHVSGSRNTEYVILTCTGCHEYYSYSVRQYKGDFGCNISEFEQFLQWAKWEAAKHECFLAGRVGYIEDPRDATPDDNCPTCGKPSELFVDGDCPQCNPPVDRLGRYAKYDAAKTLDFRRLYETGPPNYWPNKPCFEHEGCDMEPCTYEEEPFGDNYDWDENLFGSLLDESGLNPYGVTAANYAALQQAIDHERETITGRMRRDPHYLLELRPMPRKFEGKMVYIEIDYAGLERRVIDQYLLAAGVYSLDNLGCLRDEKGRCLACLRPGPHLPFYWGQE